ncbi:Agmo [Symbiodinium natans]|uniref:Agmo protein n=1 Tax=Symbiodinium natans TaxID=878477 RepID=A0A812QYA1_9DINO|nr:Agmo [Symbiodinium natans]
MTWLSEGLQCMFYLVPPKHLSLSKGDKVPNFIESHGTVMFFLLMFTELAVGSCVYQKTLYRFSDFLSSISSGTCQQFVVALMTKFADPKGAYRLVNESCRLVEFDVKGKPFTTWICLVLGMDLAYYWAHRSMHMLHTGWAAHSAHHSGEDYNMATALRQGSLQPLMTWVFSLPLALVFPAESILIHSQLNMLYQFWIHTELCGRLGALEYVLNTPFHHRMHHRPPGNCNYAGVLIIWDRLFNTYDAETERLDYFGLAQSAGTFNAVELNLQHWRKMGRFHLLRGGCFWHLLRSSVSARAQHKMEWTPRKLLQPYEPMLDAKSSWILPEKEVRPKYRGAELQLMGKAAAVAMYLGAFVCLQRVSNPTERPKLQLLCAAAGGFTWLHALGDFLDKGSYSTLLVGKLFLSTGFTALDMGIFGWQPHA